MLTPFAWSNPPCDPESVQMFDVCTERSLPSPVFGGGVPHEAPQNVVMSSDGSVCCIRGTEWRDVKTQRILLTASFDRVAHALRDEVDPSRPPIWFIHTLFNVPGCMLVRDSNNFRRFNSHNFVDVRDPEKVKVIKFDSMFNLVLSDDTRHLFYMRDARMHVASDAGNLECDYDLTNANVIGVWSERNEFLVVVLRASDAQLVRLNPTTATHTVVGVVPDVRMILLYYHRPFKFRVSPDRRFVAWWASDSRIPVVHVLRRKTMDVRRIRLSSQCTHHYVDVVRR